MNKFFLPSPEEERLIQIVQEKCRNEFVLIRLTKTMLDKSIIDASEGLRNILFDNRVIDFKEILQKDKVFRTSIVLSQNEIFELKTSYYRPQSKSGDPRFCIYGLKKIAAQNDLLYFTVFESNLVVIHLKEGEFESTLNKLFKIQSFRPIIGELRDLISDVKKRGFIRSISPHKRNPKDVGHTLELALKLPLNSLTRADYKGEIEIKSKRKQSGTNDSLFSCVPNWDISTITSSKAMVLKYGYKSIEHKGFMDLYVTVKNTPNNQNLFLEPENKAERLFQYYCGKKDKKIETCIWEYPTLKARLLEKHPTTVWIIAEEKIINNEIYFHYQTIQLTQHPIFSQFISLIRLGIVSFDWRGKVKPNGSGYRDHGHGFRINPRKRNLLFTETNEVLI